MRKVGDENEGKGTATSGVGPRVIMLGHSIHLYFIIVQHKGLYNTPTHNGNRLCDNA